MIRDGDCSFVVFYRGLVVLGSYWELGIYVGVNDVWFMNNISMIFFVRWVIILDFIILFFLCFYLLCRNFFDLGYGIGIYR